jgi:hypothetical protein
MSLVEGMSMDSIAGFFSTVFGVSKTFILSPWYTQLILLFYSVLYLAVVGIVLLYIFLKLTGIYLYVYSEWYLPAVNSILRQRMHSKGYSEDQIKAALRGNMVGRPVHRDRSKDISPATEEEKVFDELIEVERQLAELDDPNSEASKQSIIQGEQWAAFLEENPDYLRDAVIHSRQRGNTEE